MSRIAAMVVYDDVPAGCVAFGNVADWWGSEDRLVVADLSDCELRERHHYVVLLPDGRYVMAPAFDGSTEQRVIIGRVVGVLDQSDDEGWQDWPASH
jgi:hypothetical protein